MVGVVAAKSPAFGRWLRLPLSQPNAAQFLLAVSISIVSLFWRRIFDEIANGSFERLGDFPKADGRWVALPHFQRTHVRSVDPKPLSNLCLR